MFYDVVLMCKIYLNYFFKFFLEVAFWNNRIQNLKYIFQQLRDQRIMKMTTIVQMTNSAYYPCLKNIYANVVSGNHMVTCNSSASSRN